MTLRPRAWTRCLLVAALGLCFSVPASAEPSDVEKILTIAGVLTDTPALDVTLDLEQAATLVGDPVRFKVRGNRACFLYLYVTDPTSDSSTLILPNGRQPDNRLPAGKSLTVPKPEVVFVLDDPGAKQVTLIASTRYLEIRPGNARQIGDLMVSATKDLDAVFAAKGMGAQNGHVRIGDDELVVIRMDMQVTQRPEPAPTAPVVSTPASPGMESPASAAPSIAPAPAAPQQETASIGIPFLATARNQYREGEKLRVVFGADREGWVHLYVIEPTGRYTRLVQRKTDGRTVETATVRAEAPGGEHVLIAAYTEGPDFDEHRLDEYSGAPAAPDGARAKSLRLVTDEASTPLALQRIRILDARPLE